MTAQSYTAEALAGHRRSRNPRPGAGGPLGIAAACLVGMAGVWVAAEFVPAVHLRDALLLHDFTRLNHPGVESFGNFFLHLLEPLEFILWGVALVAIALARGRVRTAVAVAAILALAPFTAETLKPVLAHSHAIVGGLSIGAASWPSGHAAAALALALSAVLVVPARLRPFAWALGLAFAGAVGVILLILAWHMPSDVLGGYLVAGVWAALALAALRAAERRWPSGSA